VAKGDAVALANIINELFGIIAYALPPGPPSFFAKLRNRTRIQLPHAIQNSTDMGITTSSRASYFTLSGD
jgi:hypothetical protein